MSTAAKLRALCRDISLSLQAADPEALGEGRPSGIGGETFQVLQAADGHAALLLTFLGRVQDDQARSVYEQLLLLQLTGWNNPDLRFGFDPLTGQVLLCTRLPGPHQLEPAALQALIQRLLGQIGHWRGSLLQAVRPDALDTTAATSAAPIH